jgi:hypothetical protein
MDWRGTEETPDWTEGGPAEFERQDGSTVRGTIKIEDWYDVPNPMVTLDDGSGASFHEFRKWRLIVLNRDGET